MNPEYPVYIISKGRWESRLTANALLSIGVPFKIVIEPQEYEKYSAVLPENLILTLPFSNLGQGSIPARNWVWEHSSRAGALRHWILDDNIRRFFRYNRNIKCPILNGTCFKVAEDFIDRYENIAISGFQYFMFVPRKNKINPIILNTRIYSCILIQNKIPFRWRGKYNEDTDLSIRALKAGYCTVLFNTFLAHKMTTLTMKGGNTDELYKGDGRLDMARSLQQQHPDIVVVKRRWNRWQHVVDYSRFKANRLIKKRGLIIPPEVNNYGMELVRIKKAQNGRG